MRHAFSTLEDAFTSAGSEAYYWLVLETGKIIFFDDEIYQALTGGETEKLAEWQKEIAEDARPILIAGGEIEAGEEFNQTETERYVEIIPPDSDEKWKVMRDFVTTVKNERLQEKLADALRGGKPFRRFKDVLWDYPDERENWFRYESRRLREYIEDWARAEGIEIDFEN
jgi:hypothetical protein